MRARVEPTVRLLPGTGCRGRLPARGHVSPRLLPRQLARPARGHLRTLAYEITVAEARERERIALGLHDEIGQFLTLARLKLGALRDSPPGVEASELLDEIASLLAQASHATRSATFDLSSPVLRLGLEQALRSLADRLAADSRLQVIFDGALPPLHLPEAVQAVVFRGVRELCLNVQKHAHAARVSISAWGDGRSLKLCVADDGVGFRTDASRGVFSRTGGFGLASTQAQIQAIGGRLEISSCAGLGTRITILLPNAVNAAVKAAG